jgi:hypothetical protein
LYYAHPYFFCNEVVLYILLRTTEGSVEPRTISVLLKDSCFCITIGEL